MQQKGGRKLPITAAHLVEGQQSVGLQEVAVRPVELGANDVLSGSEGARRKTEE